LLAPALAEGGKTTGIDSMFVGTLPEAESRLADFEWCQDPQSPSECA
jgi:hypothetical protein